MKKESLTKLIIGTGFFAFFLLGYIFGNTVMFMSVIKNSDVTIDMNESKIIPVMLDWMEEKGYFQYEEPVIINKSYIEKVGVIEKSKSENLTSNLLTLNRIGVKFMNEHEYTESYKCRNYSQDFYRMIEKDERLSELFDVKIKRGERINKNGTKEAHAWNEICFEFDAQTSTIKNYDKKFPLKQRRMLELEN